jgi:hypothetical protein
MPTIHEVQQALQRCLTAEPPNDFRLSADSAQLATVFAEMRFSREEVCDLETLSSDQVTAFERWKS